MVFINLTGLAMCNNIDHILSSTACLSDLANGWVVLSLVSLQGWVLLRNLVQTKVSFENIYTSIIAYRHELLHRVLGVTSRTVCRIPK